MNSQHPLITTQQLQALFDNKNLILLDATMDKVGASLKDEKLELIPNSLFFDIEKRASEPNSPLPHTLISADKFSNYLAELGINKDSIIVVYDRWGVYSSPRAWWIFKTYGFENVFVLDGGLPAWKDNQLPIVDSYRKAEKTAPITVHLYKNWIATAEEILQVLEDKNTRIVDARSSARFLGKQAEPRPGLRSGHIPNSYNVFFENVLDKNFIQAPQNLKSIFESIGDSKNDYIFSCGSGVTASILALVAYSIGNQSVKVYDGSWSEWGANPELPIE